jgi:hypothetical protein
MAKGDNAILPLYEDADHLTGRATGAITGGRFVAVSGDLEASPLLNASSPSTTGGNIKVAQAGAGVRALGVAAYDAAADGDKIHVYAGRFVVPMVAGANITAGVQVESDAAGKPITLASGIANGIAVSTATTGNTVYIALR